MLKNIEGSFEWINPNFGEERDGERARERETENKKESEKQVVA